MMCCDLKQLLQTSASTARTKRTVETEDMGKGNKQASISPHTGIPVEIQWLVEFLVAHALHKVSLVFISNIHVYT